MTALARAAALPDSRSSAALPERPQLLLAPTAWPHNAASAPAALPTPALPVLDARALAQMEVLQQFGAFYSQGCLSAKDSARQFSARLKAGFRDGLSASTSEYLAKHALRGLSPDQLRLKYFRMKRDGMRSLARPRNSKFRIDAELREWLIGQLVKPRTKFIAITNLHRAALSKGFKVGLRQLQRFVRKFRRENKAELLIVTNPDSARSRYATRIGDASEAITAPFQCVQLDGSPSDVMTLDGRRQIIMMVDVFTRLACAIVAPSESGEATGRLLVAFFGRLAVPKQIVTDGGSGFLSARIKAFLFELGIDLHPLPPYSPDRKPHIESLFHTLNSQLLPMLPGYLGRNVAARSELRAQVATGRRRGMDERDVLQVTLTDAELQQRLDYYFERIYPHQVHSGLGPHISPAQKFTAAIAAGAVVSRIVPGQVAACDALLLLAGESRVVSGEGVQCDQATYWHDDLIPLIGHKVQIGRCPDRGQLLIDAGAASPRRFIVAENTALLGESRRERAIAARIRQRSYFKSLRKTARRLSANAEDDLSVPIMLAAPEGLPEIRSIPFETPGIEAGAQAAAAISKSHAGARTLAESDPAADPFARLGEAADRAAVRRLEQV